MCGMCGFLQRIPGRRSDLELLARMTARLAHRGPEAVGRFHDSNVALGHSRLAIIDPEGGAQPISNEDGSVWVIHNGEIFNYLELGRELAARGHRLRTHSDAEVIVHAWEEWGRDCFTRFNGQWALALWDSSRRRLVLSRDRLGIRPLYYVTTRERLLFASEVKALFADPAVNRSLDPAGLAEFFTFWCPVAPRTVFEGVREVKPGHLIEVGGKSFELEERCYWALDFPLRGAGSDRSLRDAAESLRARLSEATRLRFTRSDVPVGAYVSGGLDSSVIAALVARESGRPPVTFSIRFTEGELDEGRYQKRVIERIGTEHHEVLAGCDEIGAVFPEVVRHTERPILRAAPAPLYLLSRLVRSRGYKVVVTGEGADEVLAGYDIFRELKVRLFLARAPDSGKRPAILARLYPWMARGPSSTPAFARAFFSKELDPTDPAVSHRPRWTTTRSLLSLLTPGVREEVAGFPVEEELIARLPAEHTSWDPVARAQWLEMTALLPGYILSSQGDRMLMAHSVEGRFPFLDHEVVELANRIPMHFKLFGLEEKHVLKEAFGDLVPAEILRRPKQPYRSPDAASFFGGGRVEWVTELLRPESVRRAGLFRPEAVEGLVAKCRAVGGSGMSNTDNMRLVGVISTMLLHRQFIEGDGGSCETFSGNGRVSGEAGPSPTRDGRSRPMQGAAQISDTPAGH